MARAIQLGVAPSPPHISYVSKSYFRLFRAARPRDGGAGAGLGGPGREMKPRADA